MLTFILILLILPWTFYIGLRTWKTGLRSRALANWLTCTGAALNGLVLAFNGFRMPVSGYWKPWTLNAGSHTLLTTSSRLTLLADVHGPNWLRYSLGDCFIWAGVALLLLIIIGEAIDRR